jgi:hypothetical protein
MILFLPPIHAMSRLFKETLIFSLSSTPPRLFHLVLRSSFLLLIHALPWLSQETLIDLIYFLPSTPHRCTFSILSRDLSSFLWSTRRRRFFKEP